MNFTDLFGVQTTHIEYIIAASNLHAYNYGLKGHTDLATHKKVAANVKVPSFTPKANLRIQVNDNEAPPENPRAFLRSLFAAGTAHVAVQVTLKKMSVPLRRRSPRRRLYLDIV